MSPSTQRNLTVAFIVAVVVACVGYTAWKMLYHPHVPVVPVVEEQAQPYYLFSGSDAGTTSPVIIGGKVIVQLPEASYGEPVSIYDADGKSLLPRLDHYSGYFIISLDVPTTTLMTISAHSLHDNQNFSLSLKPVFYR